MTDRNPDIHCAVCRKYLYSIYPRMKIPEREVCAKCNEKALADLLKRSSKPPSTSDQT